MTDKIAADAFDAKAAPTVGRCGMHCPGMFATSPTVVCALPVGHVDWHRSDEGTEWGISESGLPTDTTVVADNEAGVTAGRRQAAEAEQSELDAARAALAEALRQRDRLIGALGEVLRHFTEKGHPGRPCLRTGWVHEETVDGWRKVIATLYAIDTTPLIAGAAPAEPVEEGTIGRPGSGSPRRPQERPPDLWLGPSRRDTVRLADLNLHDQGQA